MNVTELARKIRINTNELLDVLPQYGFDIGKRAIKVDDKIATQILKAWPKIQKEMEFKKRQEEEKQKKLQKEMRKDMSAQIIIPSVITVKNFAEVLDLPVGDVIKKLMGNGIMATLNEHIDFETASIIADDLGFKVTLSEDLDNEVVNTKEEKLKAHLTDVKNEKRAPVIVIMGHVDHGKTKLLDTIRESNVVEGEAGGITQHIGAYQVVYKGTKITFIDTPGHEAFTAMRSRGAKIADIAILIVAADDSIKPQTKEAIKIIKNTGMPMIVAINKIDKPDADVERVKKDLATENLTPEDWGGSTIVQEISAKQNINIDKLLDMILLIDEMEKDKIVANPNKNAAGTIIESHMDKNQGPVATVLVQSGTLRIGDNILINGQFFGKARSLKNFINTELPFAIPSEPVKILGLKKAPQVGDLLEVPQGEMDRKTKKTLNTHENSNISSMKRFSKKEEEDEDEKIPTLNIVIKADTLGSLEVLLESLEKLSTDKVKVKILNKGLGNITDNDIITAEKQKAIILAFNVKPLGNAISLSNEKGIEIKKYNIIYNLIDDVKVQLDKIAIKEIVKKVIGKIEILAIFNKEKKTMILGGKVLSGKIMLNAKADVYRQGTMYESGTIISLQSGKEEVNEVAEGNQCGFQYKGSSDIVVGDILEIYTEEEKK